MNESKTMAAPLTKSALNELSAETVLSLAKEAYVYAYPLVLMHETMLASTNVSMPTWNNIFAPIGQFGHFRSFPDATFKAVVKPNCDTYYSCAWLDLSGEPMVLTVPDTHDRYYLMPMLDAYTNVFAAPGKRTTGTKPGNFLIAGPSFNRQVPGGMSQIKAPTNMVWILGRTQVNSAEDGRDVVYKIQDGYRLFPLSQWGKDYVAPKHVVDPAITKEPPVFVEEMDVSTFFNLANELMAKNPPPAQDEKLLIKLAVINIGAGKNFNLSDFDSNTQVALKAIPATIHQNLRDAAAGWGNLENGWNVTRSGMGNYGVDYQQRALVALIGLGANLNADASYPNCQVDAKGERLNGTKKYIIHFEKGQTPPANAFWSLTMYGPDELLVSNPINRYTIGDRSDLKFNPDGSLDIFIQNEAPSKEKQSNWLPSPTGAFSVTMRLYWPKEEFLNGTWKIPAVKPHND